ncbi:MAG: hypothetical protein RL368_2121 [Pseudomonadota bacterium]|jgi:hypothetical protein
MLKNLALLSFILTAGVSTYAAEGTVADIGAVLSHGTYGNAKCLEDVTFSQAKVQEKTMVELDGRVFPFINIFCGTKSN